MIEKDRRRIWSRISIGSVDECWPFNGYLTRDGYGRLSIGRRLFLAHRAAWWARTGTEPPFDRVVMHSCDNPRCCNPSHLRLGTQLDNIADRVAKGRDGNHKGTAHGKAKLTEADVLAIRNSDERRIVLSRCYGVTPTCIWQIKTKRTWGHI